MKMKIKPINIEHDTPTNTDYDTPTNTDYDTPTLINPPLTYKVSSCNELCALQGISMRTLYLSLQKTLQIN